MHEGDWKLMTHRKFRRKRWCFSIAGGLLLGIFLGLPGVSAAIDPGLIQVCEEDGSPCGWFVRVNVSNATLTDNGDGTATVVTGAGSTSVSDTAYGASWNGSTTVAPSQNAVYDKIESLSGGSISSGLAASLPGTCTEIQLYWATDTDTMYYCTGTNTWSPTPAVLPSGVVGVFQIGNAAVSGGYLDFLEDSDNGTNYVGLVAPSSIATSFRLTLPNALAGGDGYLLTSSSAGALSYTAPSTFQSADATLTALAGLTIADVSIIQGTGADAFSVLTCTAANQLIGVNSAGNAFECKSDITVSSITVSPSATPTVEFKDSDATAGDVNASIVVNCTDTGNGTEDCDMTFSQQIAGALTAFLTVDADGSITFGTGRTVAATTFSGALTGNVTGNVSGSAATLTGTLANVASSTSAHLYGTLSDETGSASGSPLAVFNQNPTINGATGTGVWDLGEASSFEIPNGASPTVDAAGEIAVDTTTDQLQYYGGAKRAISPIMFSSFAIPDPADTDDINILKAPYGMTIIGINCIVQGSTSATGQLQECASDGTSCTDLDSDITCDSDGAADDGSLTDSSIAANAWMRWKTTSVSGTPTFLTVTFRYYIAAD
jgi:hypothetical protein